MNIIIRANLDNDAFAENPSELSEIIAQQIPQNLTPGDSGKLKDKNGNTVGDWEVNERF